MNSVNARELHTFLGVGKDFSTWIKAQIERARLVEHPDFEVFAAPPKRGAGNRGQKTEYALAIDAAMQ